MQISQNFTGGPLTKDDIELIDPGLGYTQRATEISVITASGSGLAMDTQLNEDGSIIDYTVTDSGEDYAPGDILLVSSPIQYQVGQLMNLRAQVSDPLQEVARIGFYANGITIEDNSTAEGASANVIFTPESEEYSFITVRPIFGDGRDLPPQTMPENGSGLWMDELPVSGSAHWGWKRSWEQQHCFPGRYICPPWYWGDTNYWAWPPPWLAEPSAPEPFRFKA